MSQCQILRANNTERSALEWTQRILLCWFSQHQKLQNVRDRASHKTNLRSSESIVEIKKEAYQSNRSSEVCSLTRDTCFDCNEILTVHTEGPIQTATLCDPISTDLLHTIQQAVKQSPEVEEYQKTRFNL